MSELAANLIGSLLGFAKSIIKLYIPLFFTFRYLRDKDVDGQRRIVKFWCLYSLFFVVSQVLESLLSKNIYPFIEIGLFGLMNYENYEYAEKIYDSVIPPLFEKHKTGIEELAHKIEGAFEQQARKLQKGVKESFQAKAKRVVGSILVQVMNPNINQDEHDKEQ